MNYPMTPMLDRKRASVRFKSPCTICSRLKIDSTYGESSCASSLAKLKIRYNKLTLVTAFHCNDGPIPCIHNAFS